MFPTPEEIRKAGQYEFKYLLDQGFDHGEIDLEFPVYKTKLTIIIRQGKMEYAKITEHPKGIRPNIPL